MPPGRSKVYENLIRRTAARQLLALHRTRRRDRLAHDFGTYRLVDRDGVTVASGRLRDIHVWLATR
jgi:hypothetical protein